MLKKNNFLARKKRPEEDIEKRIIDLKAMINYAESEKAKIPLRAELAVQEKKLAQIKGAGISPR